MKRFSYWMFVLVFFIALLSLSSLHAAQPKKVRLAFSALAYANPPFWIALAQSRDTLGAHMNQALVPSLEGIKYVLDFPADKQPTSKGKNPANFVDLRFVRKLEEEGFFKKLSIH